MGVVSLTRSSSAECLYTNIYKSFELQKREFESLYSAHARAHEQTRAIVQMETSLCQSDLQ